MAIPYTQSSMANVRAGEGTFRSFPFIEDGDATTSVYNLICSQRASDYAANQLDLDDPMTSAAAAGVIELPWPGDSSAYFVGDTAHASQPGGMLGFTRTFANIPQSTTTPSGSAFVTFPGIAGSYVVGSQKSISALSMTSGTKGVTITTTTTHELSVNSNINLTMDYTVGSDPFIYSINSNFRVLAVPTTTTFTIDVGHYWPSQVTLSLDYGRVYATTFVRGQTSKNVSTQTRYDYILPGVTPGIPTALDVNLPPAFLVMDTKTGLETDTIVIPSQFSVTIPSRDEYLDMVNEEKNIVIESSLAEWAGNILVQTTKTCKAR